MDEYVKGISGATKVPPELFDHEAHAYNYMLDLNARCEYLRSELAFAVDWECRVATGLPSVANRNYPDIQGCQYGTADLVGRLKTGDLYVADWKTGGTDGAEEQLLSLACAARWAHRFTGPVTISCLQVNEHGVWPKERSVSNEELDAHADAMRFQWEDIGKRNDPIPGVHCTTLYCPHLAYCSAITEAVVQSAETSQDRKAEEPLVNFQSGHRLTDKPASDAEAGHVISIAKAAKRQIDYWELAMKQYIKNGGRVTAGQYEWGPGGNGYRWRKES